MITRLRMLKILNPVLGLLFVLQFASGFMLEESPSELWGEAHEWGARLLLAAAALHVILNWNWIKANFFSRRGTAST